MRTTHLSLAFALALVPVVVACSSSNAGPTADGAAQDTATAFCNRAQACAPFYVQQGYGDVATCTTRFKAQVLGLLNAPSTALTPQQAEDCAAALPNAACGDVLGRNLPDACKPKAGALADGTACADDAQCKSQHCSVPSDQTCGVCAARKQIGDACTRDDDCAFGAACANQTCTKYGAQGDACDATHPCNPTLYCNANKICAQPLAEGAACSPPLTFGTGCNGLNGDYCNPQSACQAIAMGNPGDSCGLVNGDAKACKGAGATCKGSTLPPFMGTCQAGAADGASCSDAQDGPHCQLPAVCVNGQCKLPDPASCK